MGRYWGGDCEQKGGIGEVVNRGAVSGEVVNSWAVLGGGGL